MVSEVLQGNFRRVLKQAAERHNVTGKTEGKSTTRTINECEMDDINRLTREPWSGEARKIRRENSKLTVYDIDNKIRYHEARCKSRVVVLTVDTGSSKTTQVPKQEAYREAVANPDKPGKIICLQPKRVATTSSADRVAAELDS